MEELPKIKFKQLPWLVKLCTIWVLGHITLWTSGFIYIMWLIGTGQV